MATGQKVIVAVALFSLTGNVAPQADVRCDGGWCVIRKATLEELLRGAKQMQDHITELHKWCGWER